ncbi:hypothetical protein BaRGS_00037425 [Batillaria attramentaria]|uniref:G-protein coupled receptors family 3 profile domain-containing protein n=1 Tax=Batillaria attramentaria TaxID=370345 RepID=A0ABD0J8X9_9CAEN
MRLLPLLAAFVVLGVGLTGGRTPLYIGGFFPMSGNGWLAGPETLPAVELAIQLLNNRTDILPDHTLHLQWYDTEASSTTGMRRLIDLINNGPPKLFIIGPALSRVAVHLCVAATAWNIVQVSFSARSSELEDREVYPHFYRSIPSDAMLNTLRLQFIRHFRWKRIAVLYQEHSANLYYKSMEELVPKLREEGVEIIMFERVTDDVTPTVYRQGMYGEKYVYMLPGWAGGGFWRSDSFDSQYNCTANQLTAALENHFSMNYLSYTSDNTSVLGMTVKEFRDAMMERAGQSTEYSAFAFDAMFSIAQVLHMASTDRGLNLSDFSYDNTNFSSIFVEDLQQLKTSGISGPVEFDEKGGRLGISVLRQMQDGVRIQVGQMEPRGETLDLDSFTPILWPGDRIPRDGALRSRRADFLPLEASVPISVLAGTGLLVALTFLAANFRFRNLRYIKLSSPTMNNVVSLGCGLGYISVILYSLDGRLLSHHEFGIMCNLRLVVLCVAYSLAFGALFFKTWRVHRIMANKRLEKIRMKDRHLLAWLLGLVALDILFVSLWAAIDPLHRATSTLTEEYWLGAMLVYKGLLLLFGLFLAWETRKIQVEALNDSKYIGMCVYNMAVVCIVGVPVSFLINNDYYVGNYAISCLFIILGDTITLCFVFVPKMYAIYHNPSGEVDVRFPTQAATMTGAGDGNSSTARSATCTTLGTARVTPLGQLTANIAMQRRLEAMVTEVGWRSWIGLWLGQLGFLTDLPLLEWRV